MSHYSTCARALLLARQAAQRSGESGARAALLLGAVHRALLECDDAARAIPAGASDSTRLHEFFLALIPRVARLQVGTGSRVPRAVFPTPVQRVASFMVSVGRQWCKTVQRRCSPGS